MKFFIDTADIKEIREAAAMGLVDGVTTNPSLVAKTGRKFRDVLLEICDIVKGPVSAEVVGTNYDDMMKEARELAALRPNIVVKIPLIPEGLKAVRTCTDEGIKTNVTLCFSATQALLAAKAGATYISPFVGRLDDISTERHAADRRDRARSTTTTTSRPRCSSRRCATRCTCRRPRSWARTSRRARSRCCCSSRSTR